MPKPMSNAGKKADVQKQGHTTRGQYGSDPDIKGTYGAKKGEPRDLSVGVKGK